METKKKAADRDLIKWRLGFHNCFSVDGRGRSGGLMMLWYENIEVEILSFSFNHIDSIVKDKCEFRLTSFYGEPAVSDRIIGWNLLRWLGERWSLPWVVVGDFNEVTCSTEVQGGRGRHNWQMENFRRVLSDCNLSDLGFSGYPFTYSNR
ncbi:hypothetical protein QQ045_024567 [Rhodiola kirilowii]